TNQLLQARHHWYTDWHPPLMSLVWTFVDLFIAGPAGMLVFHNLMFWIALGLLLSLVDCPLSLTAPLGLLVGLFPPIFIALGVILKDAGMMAALFWAFAWLLYARRKRSRLGLVLALGGLFYGTAIRYNALAAALPLSILAGSTICRL